MTDPDIESRPAWPDYVQLVHARHQNASAAASLMGGQVLSWRHLGRERLFVSPRSAFADGVAIRGGVPVIFPQFGTRGPGHRHGFARLCRWTSRFDDKSSAQIALSLFDDATTLGMWPYPFTARLEVTLGVDTLEIALSVKNVGTQPFTFTCALHTYLLVADVTRARLLGLEGRSFSDATRDGAGSRQDFRTLEFHGEIDRVYGDAPDTLVLEDGSDCLEIAQSGFVDTVVWNPGDALAAAMPDLGEGNHRHFVCVEAACVERPVHLEPGENWRGTQTLRVLTAGPGRLG